LRFECTLDELRAITPHGFGAFFVRTLARTPAGVAGSRIWAKVALSRHEHDLVGDLGVLTRRAEEAEAVVDGATNEVVVGLGRRHVLACQT
jgi:hypothetical protein